MKPFLKMHKTDGTLPIEVNTSANSSLLNTSTSSTSSKDEVKFLNLKEILQLFSCAISQEQAWAVLYQILVEFKNLLQTNLDLVKCNLDQIDIYLLNFAKDGSISFNFEHKPIKISNLTSEEYEQERSAAETKVLKSVAYLIFDALDYGNNFTNEPILQTPLLHLLLLLSGHLKEYNSKGLSEDDEGYDQEEEEEESINLDKAIEMCLNNVAEAEYHYKAVCRGLYAQAYELKAFLAKIEHSKNTIQKSGKDPTHYCFEVLDKTDWAKLWMQVIHELRNGVKLRKVSQIADIRRHIEYELTPFEILLDQIRARKYHLKKISLDNSIGPEIKKDARDIILDFIRSRPPLRKSSLRTIKTSDSFNNKLKELPVNLHEQLMNSIRNYSTPLKKIQFNNSNTKDTTQINNNNTSTTTTNTNNNNNKSKKLLKADKKLLNNLTSSDDDDSDIDYDELKNLPILQEDEELNGGYSPIYLLKGNRRASLDQYNDLLMDLSSRNSKKKIKAPESLKSPLTPWRDPIENWKALVTEDVVNLNELKSPFYPNQAKHSSINISDLQQLSNSLSSLNIFSGMKKNQENMQQPSQKVSQNWQVAKSRLSTPIYFKSGPGYHDFGFVSTQELIEKITSANNKQKGECLRLTFEELCHIRNVLTKAELDYLLFDNQIFQDVSRGKVCFSCRKTKFSIFNWSSKCRICQQKICKKCLRSAQLKNGQIAQVPLFKLCPNKFSIRDSPINSSENEEYEIISCTIEDECKSDEFNDCNSFEICVDCYQIMDGVIVSANETDLQIQTKITNSPVNNRKKSNNKIDLIKSVHKKTIVSPSLSSPSTIGMDFIGKDVQITNRANGDYSPLPNKILLSHHSTPTQSSQNTPAIANLHNTSNNELSTIIVHSMTSDNLFDSMNSNDPNNNSMSRNIRQNLTLDLQPVYSK